MLLAVNVTFGQYSGTGTFTKVTSLANLTDGYYVITYDAGGSTIQAMNNTNGGSFFQNTGVSVSSGSITDPAAAIVWKITTDGSGKTIYNETSARYVSYTGTSNAAQAVTTVSNNARWTFAYGSSVFTATNVAVTARLLQYNTAAPRFAGYTGSQQNLTLYKLAAPSNAAPTASSVAVSGSTVVGQTLTGSYTYADAESNPEGTSTFQWYRADNAAGTTNKTTIASATASTYTLVAADAGKYISFAVVPKATAGTATGSETYSTYLGPVINNSPTITASPTTLSGFTYINNNGPSANQSFSVSGVNLTGAPGDVTVTAPAAYEVSLSAAGTYSASVAVPYSSATLAATPVYVRLKAGLAVATYNQSADVSGGGATATVALNGSVTNQAPTASAVAVTGADYLVGTVLTGSYTYSDYESNPQGTSTFKWYTATDNTGTGAAAISGQTAGTLTLTSAHVAKYIRFSVTPVASAGTTTGSETFSGWYGPVVAPSLVITGTTAHGSICTGTSGSAITYTITNSGTAVANNVAVASNNTMFAVSGLSSTTIAIGETATFNVVFSPTSSGAKTATITVSATGATNATASLTGTGAAAGAPTVTAPGATGITYNGATLAGTAAISSCSTAITNYGIRYSTTSGFANTAGTPVAGANLADGAFTVTLSDLLPSTTYYYKAYATNSSGTTFSSQSTFTTLAYTVGTVVATPATFVTPATFTANWNTETTATDYRLDVSTTPEFSYTALFEDFSTFISDNGAQGGVNYAFPGNNAGIFLTEGWTGKNIYYVSDAEGAPRLGTGNTSTGDGSIITPTIDLSGNGGIATLTFDVKRFGTDAAATIQVYHSANGTDAGFVQVGSNVTATSTYVTLTYTITGGTASSKIKIQNTAGNQRFNVDNIAVSYSNTLPAYNNLTVNGLAQVVSGLAENTTYYYRVRGVNTPYGVTGANSNVISVTTGKELVWNGTQWTGGIIPTIADDGTIAPGATYNTPSNLIIGSLTVSPTSTVNIPANRTITIARNLVNNAPAANFTVQDNGALVQTATGVATNTTPITVIKNTNPLYRFDYTLWSSPVAGQTMRLFSMGTSNNRFYEYKMEAGDEGYYPIENIFTTTFTAGKSYLIRMPNSIQANVTGTTNGGITTPAEYAAGTGNYIFEGKFTGTPYTGDITYNAATATSEYCATGNPYPSPINIAAFYAANAGVIDPASAIYFWRKRNNTDTSSSSYASITLADFNFTPNTGSTGTGGQDNLIYYTGSSLNWVLAPGQGFIVKATGNITYNNAMRTAAPLLGGQGFFKSGASQVSRFRMKVTAPQGDAGQMSVVYMPQGTMGLDYSLDGKLLGDASLALYTLAENTALSIQARPEFDVTDVVPAGFTANTSGSFTIALSYTDGVFANGQKVYLKDKAEGIVRDMAQGDYTFTSEAGTFNDRFEIVYTTAALGVDTPVLDASTVIVYQNGSTININSGTAVINSVNVFDIRGRKLFALDKVNASEAAIDNLTAAKQVLIVEINTDKGTVTKKIVF